MDKLLDVVTLLRQVLNGRNRSVTNGVEIVALAHDDRGEATEIARFETGNRLRNAFIHKRRFADRHIRARCCAAVHSARTAHRFHGLGHDADAHAQGGPVVFVHYWMLRHELNAENAPQWNRNHRTESPCPKRRVHHTCFGTHCHWLDAQSHSEYPPLPDCPSLHTP